jgi:hypothetical protein
MAGLRLGPVAVPCRPREDRVPVRFLNAVHETRMIRLQIAKEFGRCSRCKTAPRKKPFERRSANDGGRKARPYRSFVVTG